MKFTLATLFGAASALRPAELDYINYMAKFNKQHQDVDTFNWRYENFAAMEKFIQEHKAGNHTYTVGHNQFSDWSQIEYKSILGYKKNDRVEKRYTVLDTTMNATGVNWVDIGAVTPVKDQGACGSCWAFSTTGSLEGAHFVSKGELLSFSEQQLVDCAGMKYGNYGCYGGLQTNAYMYYEAGYLAELESVYPYISGGGSMQACQYNAASATAVDVSTFTNVTPQSVDQFKAALNLQPLAIAIEADQPCFQSYNSGIFNDPTCGTTLDHAVLAVGYGTDATTGLDYYLIKNSWNTTWGEQGYIRFAITGDGAGVCGVQLDPQFPSTN